MILNYFLPVCQIFHVIITLLCFFFTFYFASIGASMFLFHAHSLLFTSCFFYAFSALKFYLFFFFCFILAKFIEISWSIWKYIKLRYNGSEFSPIMLHVSLSISLVILSFVFLILSVHPFLLLSPLISDDSLPFILLTNSSPACYKYSSSIEVIIEHSISVTALNAHNRSYHIYLYFTNRTVSTSICMQNAPCNQCQVLSKEAVH